MKKLHELARKPARRDPRTIPNSYPLPDTYMGVEVEVDMPGNDPEAQGTVFPPNGQLTMWSRKSDGSLSNGFEYVLSRPLKGDELAAAVRELYAPPSRFFRTYTGSTHIHMDMTDDKLSLDHLRVIVLMVCALEPMLYAAGDFTREWCGFANPAHSMPVRALSGIFRDDIDDEEFSNTYHRGNYGRYYGLNLAALTAYGSIEFRYFPTATSEAELNGWISLVQRFKQAALDIGTAEAFDTLVRDENAMQQMLNTYFSEVSEEARNALGEHSRIVARYNKACATTCAGEDNDVGYMEFNPSSEFLRGLGIPEDMVEDFHNFRSRSHIREYCQNLVKTVEDADLGSLSAPCLVWNDGNIDIAVAGNRFSIGSPDMIVYFANMHNVPAVNKLLQDIILLNWCMENLSGHAPRRVTAEGLRASPTAISTSVFRTRTLHLLTQLRSRAEAREDGPLLEILNKDWYVIYMGLPTRTITPPAGGPINFTTTGPFR